MKAGRNPTDFHTWIGLMLSHGTMIVMLASSTPLLVEVLAGIVRVLARIPYTPSAVWITNIVSFILTFIVMRKWTLWTDEQLGVVLASLVIPVALGVFMGLHSMLFSSAGVILGHISGSQLPESDTAQSD